MDTEPANQNWLEVEYEEVFDNRPNLWYYGKGNWFELKNIAKWHHPVKRSQLRGSYAIWGPERSIHSKNSKGRAKGKHDGLDLYAPEGTQLYACVSGMIYDAYISVSYGNTLTVKENYNVIYLLFNVFL